MLLLVSHIIRKNAQSGCLYDAMADAEFTGIFRRRIVERIFTTFTPKIGQIQTSVGNGLYKLHKTCGARASGYWLCQRPACSKHFMGHHKEDRETRTERDPRGHLQGWSVEVASQASSAEVAAVRRREQLLVAGHAGIGYGQTRMLR